MVTLEEVRRRAESDARTYGYYLHPDPEFLGSLIEGLKKNWDRYGYPSCPCRLASGNLELDRDILCPCDYRDPDVLQYGCCYCALYMRKDLHDGTTPILPIPERRPAEKIERAFGATVEAPVTSQAKEPSPTPRQAKPEVKKKFWYCKQCGYVVYREDPPYICPICKAKREMFEELPTNPK
jgi:ferredoxin-thioredoxin reductase catalytic chain